MTGWTGWQAVGDFIPEDWFGCDRRSVEMRCLRCDVIKVETQLWESHAGRSQVCDLEGKWKVSGLAVSQVVTLESCLRPQPITRYRIHRALPRPAMVAPRGAPTSAASGLSSASTTTTYPIYHLGITYLPPACTPPSTYLGTYLAHTTARSSYGFCYGAFSGVSAGESAVACIGWGGLSLSYTPSAGHQQRVHQ